MKTVSLLALTTTILSIALNIYIYTYPSLNAGSCHWPQEYRQSQSFISKIPYFGDLYNTYLVPEIIDKEKPDDIRIMAVGDPQVNGNWPSTPYIKRLDNYGNDLYLNHIYKLMKGRLQPNHVAIMGDLLSSQWLGDSEFYNRTRRIIERIYTRPEVQNLKEIDWINSHQDVNWWQDHNTFKQRLDNGTFDDIEFYANYDIYDWNANKTFSLKGEEPLFLNVTGNHDIGYGDMTYQHLSRWWKLFGKDNYFIEYDNDTNHPWRIVMLNSLTLDGPMLQPEFMEYSWKFLNVLQGHPYNGSTILLTHIPMHKSAGFCVDGPKVEYYEESGCHGCSPDRVGLLKSTNFLSPETTQRVLSAVFGKNPNKNGIILTGHDHEGCQTWHHWDEKNSEWIANNKAGKVREITVRSTMGEYDGTIGIMGGTWQEDQNSWKFEYNECRFAVQHVWWATQIITIISGLLISLSFVL
ncbi:Ted1 protein [Martiniozyma asiatica (nom. inval.)]|nr:Ted1 protein [Martiniozyma asiatica]